MQKMGDDRILDNYDHLPFLYSLILVISYTSWPHLDNW